MRQHVSDYRNVLEVASLEEAQNTLMYMSTISMEKDMYLETQLTTEQKDALLEAILKDCQAGTMAQDGNFHPNQSMLFYVDLYFEMPNPEVKFATINRTITLYVYEDCENTLAVLRGVDFEETDG